MATLTDPTPAMRSFETAIERGEITPQKASLYPDIVAYADNLPNGSTRFAYAQIIGGKVIAFANFVIAGRENGLPVFQAGVAVPEAERSKGRAKHILAAGISELKHGFGKVIPDAAFYVEAVVGLDNFPSQRVASAVINDKPTPITDSVSGLAALHYMRQV